MSTGYGGWVSASGIHTNLRLRSCNRNNAVIGTSQNNAMLTLINPQIELLNAADYSPVFSSTGYGSYIYVFGGEIYGSGAADGVPLITPDANNQGAQFFGLKYPITMPLSIVTRVSAAPITATGIDGKLGSAYWDYSFAYDSRSDGYYPTRNATLETSAGTPWSYKVYPFRTTVNMPAKVNLGALWTQADAVKTITLEFLWPAGMSAPTRDKVFLLGSYTGSDGVKRSLSTLVLSGGTVDTSTATWSTVSYGPTLFTRYRLSVTTAVAIKQDTEVVLTFVSVPKSVSVNDIIFVDPDVAFT